jgi:hypothetical protein
MKKHRPKPRKPKRRSAPAVQPGVPLDGPGFYHGGRPGLPVGGYILPAAETNSVQHSLIDQLEDVGNPEAYDPAVAYVTTDLDWATCFAAYHPSSRGQVYEVEPEGDIIRDRDIDPEPGQPLFCDFSYRCTRARIVRVVKIPFWKTQTLRSRARNGVLSKYGPHGIFADWVWLQENGDAR